MSLKENINRIKQMMGIINESIFFRRRIDLDEVKNLLGFYTSQVYYETKNYKQFKYELVLKVVERIMWKDYKLDWSELPEQEEIEFVTKISDMFEETIRKLYNKYHN
jgi:coenzyme F420-reducing hydrogenase delta subunit